MNQSFHNKNAAELGASTNDKIPSPEEIRNAILKKLVDSGEKDKLKEMLSDRLTQSGWRDDLKEHCKNIIRKKGLEKITVEELVSEITPYGRCKQFVGFILSYQLILACLQPLYRMKLKLSSWTGSEHSFMLIIKMTTICQIFKAITNFRTVFDYCTGSICFLCFQPFLCYIHGKR
jgi:enhancer of yellow 2 transcription factor